MILDGCVIKYCMDAIDNIARMPWVTLYITGEGTEYKEGERGEKKRGRIEFKEGEREEVVNKKRREKAEERGEGEIWWRDSGRGWKVEREEGRGRDKWDRGQRRRERQTDRQIVQGRE